MVVGDALEREGDLDLDLGGVARWRRGLVPADGGAGVVVGRWVAIFWMSVLVPVMVREARFAAVMLALNASVPMASRSWIKWSARFWKVRWGRAGAAAPATGTAL